MKTTLMMGTGKEPTLQSSTDHLLLSFHTSLLPALHPRHSTPGPWTGGCL